MRFSSGRSPAMFLCGILFRDRVGGGVAPAVLPHHRTYGSVYGGSWRLLKNQDRCEQGDRTTTASISPSSFQLECSFLVKMLDAPATVPRGFRPLPPVLDSGISAILFCVSFIIEIQVSCCFFMFWPSARSRSLLCRLLTSAKPSRHLTASVAICSLTDLPG